MESALLDERKADKEVIESLLKTNRTLWRQLEEMRGMLKLHQQRKQGPNMKILQDLNGAYYLAKEYVLLAEEDAVKIAEHARHDLAMIEKFLQDEAAKMNGQADTPVGQPTNGGDNGQTQPVDQAAGAGSDQSATGQPAQGDQAELAPADPSQQVIPLAAPADQPLPVPDTNVQPEQPVMPPLQ